MQPTLTTPAETTRVQAKFARPCTHSRVVDEIRGTNGAKTGRLVCLECYAEFPDPVSCKPHE